MHSGAIMYFIGLLIAALCVGELTSQVYGWLVIAMGTMTLGLVFMMLAYLNKPVTRYEERSYEED